MLRQGTSNIFLCSIEMTTPQADSSGASCKVQMTDGWLAGFIIIAVVGFCCICGGGGYLIKKSCFTNKGVGPAN
jgi:hypothetical protein